MRACVRVRVRVRVCVRKKIEQEHVDKLQAPLILQASFHV